LLTHSIQNPHQTAKRLLLTRVLVRTIGLFLLFYFLWYKMPGNAWEYLAVTGTIYLASVFTLLVAALYWPRANSVGAYAALLLGAVGPITFLIVNGVVEKDKQIGPEIAGASSFALAFAGMIVGSF